MENFNMVKFQKFQISGCEFWKVISIPNSQKVISKNPQKMKFFPWFDTCHNDIIRREGQKYTWVKMNTILTSFLRV